MSGDAQDRRPLEGRRILVTRPAHQAGPFCAMIESAGGIALRCPALSILPPPDPIATAAIIDRVADFDLAVFTSPNAVAGLVALLGERPFPADLAIAAIGKGTTAALASHGLAASICPPQRFDSETLLAHPQLQALDGRHVLILRGEGGRGMIGPALAGRGAVVEHAVLYRRGSPADDGTLSRLLAEGVDVVTVTSSEALTSLVGMAGEAVRGRLLALPLVVGSARIADTARQQGFIEPPTVAADPGDESMLAALIRRVREQP